MNILPDELLTLEQLSALQKLREWISNSNSRLVTLGGRAGSGKTSLIAKILQDLPGSAAVGAYTGKATSVLRQKGLTMAQTLHSLLYKLDRQKSKSDQPVFTLVDSFPYDFIIIDEGSTISLELFKDLLSFKHLRLMIFGDHWQLEPVGDDPNLMSDPDILLETIHRQAANSPILTFAADCHFGRANFQFGDYGGLSLKPAVDFWSKITDVEQCIVGFNETRHKVNAYYRSKKGYESLYPKEGERIIILRNSKDFGVYNGLVAVVTKLVAVRGEIVYLNIEDDLGKKWFDLPTYRRQYGMDSLKGIVPSHYILADYGYALSCNKSQGSEWSSGLVLEELHPSWSAERWRYTAITRFKDSLIYCR